MSDEWLEWWCHWGLSSSTPGQSQNGCFFSCAFGTSPNFADQTAKYNCKKLLSDWTQSIRMSSCRNCVLAAESKRGNCERRHASPLDHRLWLEDWPGSTEVRRGQNWWCTGLPVWAEHQTSRSIWRTFGALKDAVKSVSASCEEIELNLSTALEWSSQRWSQVLSRTGPWNRGAPNMVVAAMSTLLNDCSRASLSYRSLCAMSSHLDMLSDNHISAPSRMISATSEATMSSWPPKVTLYRKNNVKFGL